MVAKGPKTRKPPNAENPLSEPSWGRRLWAASVRAGYESRLSFAKAVGISSTAIDRWDRSEVTAIIPDLEPFFRACELVGYYPDEIWRGRKREDYRGREYKGRITSAVELEDVLAEFVDTGIASQSAAVAFGKHRAAEGAAEVITRAYVQAFVERFDAALDEGKEPAIASDEAFEAARNARALDKGFDMGLLPRPKPDPLDRDD